MPHAKPAKSSKKPAGQPKPAKPAKPATPIKESAPPADLAGSESAATCCATWLPEAMKIPASEVRPFRGDADVAFHNTCVGLAAILPRESEVARLPPPFDLNSMTSTRDIALGLVYATAQVDPRSPRTLKPLVARAQALRGVMLPSAVALMHLGLLPAPRVRKIEKGRGVRDAAQDCVDLAVLFRENWTTIKGKCGITRAHLDDATEVGTRVLTMLKPAKVRARKSDPHQAAIDARDRLWTLLRLRHGGQLRVAGMWLWRDDVDEHVPPLLSARRKVRAATGEESPKAKPAAKDATKATAKPAAPAPEASAPTDAAAKSEPPIASPAPAPSRALNGAVDTDNPG